MGIIHLTQMDGCEWINFTIRSVRISNIIMVVRFTKQGKIFTIKHTFVESWQIILHSTAPATIRTHTEVKKQHRERPAGDIRVRQNGIYSLGFMIYFYENKEDYLTSWWISKDKIYETLCSDI